MSEYTDAGSGVTPFGTPWSVKLRADGHRVVRIGSCSAGFDGKAAARFAEAVAGDYLDALRAEIAYLKQRGNPDAAASLDAAGDRSTEAVARAVTPGQLAATSAGQEI